MATRGGRLVIKRRRLRGRHRLTPRVNNRTKRVNWKA
jgi:hypothetical protein